MSAQPERHPAIPQLYTEQEVAALLRLDSDNHIRKHASEWPHVVIARKRMFTPEHVAEIVARHTRTGNEPDRPAQQGTTAPAVAGRATRGKSSPQ